MLAAWLRRLSSGRDDAALTFGGLSRRGLGRRRSRSLAASASLACGSFLVVAIGVNRLDATKDATRRGAGTGGFVAIAESTLPLTRSLNTSAGLEALGLDAALMKDVSVVPFRVRPGDDASCLNLNRAQNPRLLGVDPRLLKERSAFTFAGVAAGFSAAEGWGLIARDGVQPGPWDPIPAIGDAASIQWALGRKLGDVLTFRDERGAEFQIRLVAGLANSILQGSLVIDEREFVRRFPGIAGYQFHLIDAPPAGLPGLSTELTRGLQDYGMQITPAMDRLNSFNAVQNTYLSTFQLLGGLGLVFGSLGLGVVLLRNALERRGELALLQAVGYPLARLHGLLFREHALLLLAGLAVGVGAAVLGVLPVALASSQPVPVTLLSGLIGLVLVLGFMSTWIATRSAIRGPLLDNLRSE